MNKTKAVNAKMFKKEREILQKLKHPNIINLIETFDTSKKILYCYRVEQRGRQGTVSKFVRLLILYVSWVKVDVNQT